MSRALACLYLAGPAIIAISIALPHPDSFDTTGLWLIVATAPMAAAALLATAGRLPVWAIQLAVVLGTVYITGTVYFSHESNSFYAAFYIWAGLYAYFFFGLFWGTMQLAWIGATYAWALDQVPQQSPVTRWLLTIGTIAVAGVLAAVMVQRLRRVVTESQARARNLAAVDVVAHELARHADPESAGPAICQAALDVAEAKAALLWRPGREGTGLVAVASTLPELKGLTLPFLGKPSGALRAFASVEPFFVADARGHPDVDQGLVERTAARSCLWQPVLREQVPEGVLAVVWDRHVGSLDEDVAQAVGVLAAEASIAIGRSELLNRLEKRARTDDLTGLLNRRAWDEELLREMARATRLDTPLGVAMLDLDHFRPTTTSTVTRPATAFSSKQRRRGASCCERPTCWRATAASSSRSRSPTARPRMPDSCSSACASPPPKARRARPGWRAGTATRMPTS